MTVETLDLPHSTWLLQWRSDRHWRALDQAQHQDEVAGLHEPLADEWAPWTGTCPPVTGRGGDHWDGTPCWWSLVGELPEADLPDVVLADGGHPPILTVGRVWACEWVSPVQHATVRLGGEEFVVPFRRPDYLPVSAG